MRYTIFYVTQMATTRTYHCYRCLSYFSYKYACFRESSDGDFYTRDYLNELFHKNRSWSRFTTIRLTSMKPIWDTPEEEEAIMDLLQVKKIWLAK